MKGIPRIVELCNGGTTTLYRYRALVVGELWCGVTASHEYGFEAEASVQAHLENIQRLAGDFSSVDDFELSVWGELCLHCHNQGWLLVKKFTPEGEEAYLDTVAEESEKET